MDYLRGMLHSMKIEMLKKIFTKKFVKDRRMKIFLCTIPAAIFQVLYLNQRWFLYKQYLFNKQVQNSAISIGEPPFDPEANKIVSKYLQQVLPR